MAKADRIIWKESVTDVRFVPEWEPNCDDAEKITGELLQNLFQT